MKRIKSVFGAFFYNSGNSIQPKKHRAHKTSFKSIFMKILVALILVPLALLGVVFFINSYQEMQNNAEQYLRFFTKEVSDDIKQRMDYIDNACMLFLSNPNLREQLTHVNEKLDDPDIPDNLDVYNAEINKILKYQLFFNLAWDDNLIESVFLYINPENYYFVSRTALTQSRMADFIHVAQQTFDIPRERRLAPIRTEDPAIYYEANINDLYSFSRLGKIVFKINESRFANFSGFDYQYQNPLIITYKNEDGTIISQNRDGMIGQTIPSGLDTPIQDGEIVRVLIDGEPYYSAKVSLELYGVTTIIAVREDEVFEGFSRGMIQYIIFVLVLSVISVITGLMVSTLISNPIEEIMGMISQYGERNFDIKLPPSDILELDRLGKVFNNMTGDMNYLIRDVYEKQLLISETELKILQSQVNPHFLFNILEIISCEARLSNNDVIYNMVTSLGELLRANMIFQKNEKITIAEELKYINFYLELQKTRFGERLNSDLYIEEAGIRNYLLPKMCIQTIVENAVVHGIENKRGKTVLKMVIWEDDGDVFVVVFDNGIGFDVEEVLQAKRHSTVDSPNYVTSPLSERTEVLKGKHSGIGLLNSDRRIKLLYGPEYGVFIESVIGKGTKVLIRLPVDR